MSLVENRREQIFPILDAAQIETAKRFASGPARTFAPGETIFLVGERHAPAWLVLKGEIAITRRDGLNREAPITSMGAGQFTGEMSELSGRGTLAAGHAGPQGCTALPFTADHIRALIIGSAELGETLMRAFILRRVALIQDGGAGSVLIGQPGTPDLLRLQDFPVPQRLSLRRAGRGDRRGGARAGGADRRAAGRAAADGLPERHRAEAADQRRGRHVPRHHAGDRHQRRLRRGRGRRRAGGACHRGLCRIRRPVGAGAGSAARSAARPARRRGSRTISAFRPASPGRRWPAGRSARRRSSAPRSPSRWRCRISTAADRRGGRTIRCGLN